MPAHLQEEHRHGQRQADPEPPRHIDELGARGGVGRRHHRLQRHTADRARAGGRLPHLRVHRAGVDGALRHRLVGALRLFRREIARRVGFELPLATCGTEIERPAGVRRPMLRRVRIDHHAAHRVLQPRRSVIGGGMDHGRRVDHRGHRARADVALLRRGSAAASSTLFHAVPFQRRRCFTDRRRNYNKSHAGASLAIWALSSATISDPRCSGPCPAVLPRHVRHRCRLLPQNRWWSSGWVEAGRSIRRGCWPRRLSERDGRTV